MWIRTDLNLDPLNCFECFFLIGINCNLLQGLHEVNANPEHWSVGYSFQPVELLLGPAAAHQGKRREDSAGRVHPALIHGHTDCRQEQGRPH